MARAAVLGRLSATWRTATIRDARTEAPGVRTLVLDVPDWPGHQAGQHVDVRLTAEDGYQAQRSYSIASAPEAEHVELTVEELEDGEVSPYLVEDAAAGRPVRAARADRRLLHLARRPDRTALLVAGGSGVVPLMAMIRHRRAAGSDVDARLLLSVKTRADIIYRSRARGRRRAAPHHAHARIAAGLERATRAGSTSRCCARSARRRAENAHIYVCGPTPFVEEAARLLVALGHLPASVRTERFGNTGGTA